MIQRLTADLQAIAGTTRHADPIRRTLVKGLIRLGQERAA